ncbi:MAG: hypothetical protein JXQ25_01325 [Deltaproteobacteria bacterium]|nr:hypothetical protein [Deltaproteobacteria bacterium]
MFSTLGIIFCVFLTENNFVNALIPIVGIKETVYFLIRSHSPPQAAGNALAVQFDEDMQKRLAKYLFMVYYASKSFSVRGL